MISIRALTKRFGALRVLDTIDLEIVPRRVTALVGPNGAGKTTLIKSVLGLVRPDSGRLLFDGERVTDESSYRARIGYMPQIARFPENLTGAELLAMLWDLRSGHGVPAAVDEELVRLFHLSAELRKPLRNLSGGTRQKVNAVAAFLFSPELLILDEPTAGLDPVSSGILKDKIVRARDGGTTVVITSHVMSELDELCDDVAFICGGRVRFAGSVHDLKLRTRQFSLERAVAQLMLEQEAA